MSLRLLLPEPITTLGADYFIATPLTVISHLHLCLPSHSLPLPFHLLSSGRHLVRCPVRIVHAHPPPSHPPPPQSPHLPTAFSSQPLNPHSYFICNPFTAVIFSDTRSPGTALSAAGYPSGCPLNTTVERNPH